MFAVIKTGGKQYRVIPQQILKVEKIEGNVGDKITLSHVLMVSEGSDVTIGAPFLENAQISAEIIEQTRGKKVIAFKKRRRQNSKRTRGHRQELTVLRILDITVNGVAESSKAAKKQDSVKAKAATAKNENIIEE